ncbi:hypothetical protein BS78_09G021500 [Paspalum vaginatum]|nr:hypothetical protein BS78_09G021500 [Paspalum vaginatum]
MGVVSDVKIVGYVILCLGYMFGLEFSIPSFGFPSLFGEEMSMKQASPDLILGDEVAALSRTPERSTFKSTGGYLPCHSVHLLNLMGLRPYGNRLQASCSVSFLIVNVGEELGKARSDLRRRRPTGAPPKDFNVIYLCFWSSFTRGWM